VFYDRLPHYFMEFDALDKRSGEFLDTPRRHALLAGLPVVSVRVLHSGALPSAERLAALCGPSGFIALGHLERPRVICMERGLDVARALRETEPSVAMAGLYIKVEEDGVVQERYKYIRDSFLTTMLNAEGHWLDRPIIPNGLTDGVDLWTS